MTDGDQGPDQGSQDDPGSPENPGGGEGARPDEGGARPDAMDVQGEDAASEAPDAGSAPQRPSPAWFGGLGRRLEHPGRWIAACAVVIALAGTATWLLTTSPWRNPTTPAATAQPTTPAATTHHSSAMSEYCATVKKQNAALPDLGAATGATPKKALAALEAINDHAPDAIRADTTRILDAFRALDERHNLSPLAEPSQHAALIKAGRRVDAYTTKACGFGILP